MYVTVDGFRLIRTALVLGDKTIVVCFAPSWCCLCLFRVLTEVAGLEKRCSCCSGVTCIDGIGISCIGGIMFTSGVTSVLPTLCKPVVTISAFTFVFDGVVGSSSATSVLQAHKPFTTASKRVSGMQSNIFLMFI